MSISAFRRHSIAFRYAGSSRDEEVALYSGDGAPVGGTLPTGQTLAASQSAFYFRQDTTAEANALYFTSNGGTLWTPADLRPAVISDPGDAAAIDVTHSGSCALTSAGVGETRTMANPTYIGQRISIIHDVDGGSIVITVAGAINQAGNTIATMTEAGDFLELSCAQLGGVKVWRVTANDGSVLS